jgi:hypothetical protein
MQLPPDVQKIILEVQKETKAKRRILQFSKENTIYSIIREYRKLKEQKQ